MASAEDSTTVASRRTSASASVSAPMSRKTTADAAHAAVGMAGQAGVQLDRRAPTVARDADHLLATHPGALALAPPRPPGCACADRPGGPRGRTPPTRPPPMASAAGQPVSCSATALMRVTRPSPSVVMKPASMAGQRRGQALLGLQQVVLGVMAPADPSRVQLGERLVVLAHGHRRKGQEARQQPPGHPGGQHRGARQ